ncbi:sensor histidine kinase [Desulfonatronovibrio hydrogenovorans]|uniref:sensor histidine kinase n=1 Tax=Desulfonatronovibrio hydrogenovorans TaxID=53245 RepID=UPI000A019AB8|nr:ATP-binding protein [Desulfonatronovibrio hydrogenovorans]
MCNKRQKPLGRIHGFLASFSLRAALVAYVIIPLTLALGITGHLALSALEKNVEQSMQRDLELIAKSLQLPLSYALEWDETRAIYSALDSVFSIGEIYSAYLYDQDGKEVALAGALEAEPESEKLIGLLDEGEEHGEYGDVAGSEVYSYFIPLTDSGGRVSGMLQLTRKKSDFIEYIQSIRTQGQVVMGLGLLIMTGLVLYGQHRALGRHFAKLIKSMSRVADGDTRHRFEAKGPREIMVIGRQFNQMLDSIDEAQIELKKRRQKQEHLQEQLRRSEKLAAIGRLSAGIAHELGTPLSTVSAKAQRALRHKDIPGHLAESFQSIRGEVSRMEYIIRQLLDFSRSSSLQKRQTSLSMLAHSSLAAVSEEAVRLNCQIRADGERLKKNILVDPIRIEQALVNLLRNAIHAAGQGQVVLSWGMDHKNAWLQVDDNGPGISAEIRQRIFEPFFTTKNVGSGTGLGLSVAHGIIEEHKGRIMVVPSSLGGACFRITLPLNSPEKNNQTGLESKSDRSSLEDGS